MFYQFIINNVIVNLEKIFMAVAIMEPLENGQYGIKVVFHQGEQRVWFLTLKERDDNYTDLVKAMLRYNVIKYRKV